MNDIFETGNLTRLLKDMADTNQRMVRIGMESERERLLPHFRAIFKAYERALGDPKAVIPSPLMAAIAVAQQEIGGQLAKDKS